MDTSLLLIIVGSSVLFLAIVIYKIYWFLNKINVAQKRHDEKHN
jgi:hypothetical protein